MEQNIELYRVIKIPITTKTEVYSVIDLSKWSIATFDRQVAAEKFAVYMNKHKINSLEAWRQVPHSVKLSFISSSTMVSPLLRSMKTI